MVLGRDAAGGLERASGVTTLAEIKRRQGLTPEQRADEAGFTGIQRRRFLRECYRIQSWEEGHPYGFWERVWFRICMRLGE